MSTLFLPRFFFAKTITLKYLFIVFMFIYLLYIIHDYTLKKAKKELNKLQIYKIKNQSKKIEWTFRNPFLCSFIFLPQNKKTVSLKCKDQNKNKSVKERTKKLSCNTKIMWQNKQNQQKKQQTQTNRKEKLE